MIQIKRIYETAGPSDGRRILVDRLWPRGLKKSQAQIDEWLKAVAPSTDLRRWFNHEPGRWDEFRRRYIEELVGQGELDRLKDLAKQQTVTLLYAAKDIEHNHALVLKEVLMD